MESGSEVSQSSLSRTNASSFESKYQISIRKNLFYFNKNLILTKDLDVDVGWY